MTKRENKFSYDQAQAEIAEWLEFKHISERKRNDNADFEEVLIDEMCQGLLKKNEDNSLTYTLQEPVKAADGEVILDTLTFKPRITVADLNKQLKGVKPSDVEGRQVAYISAITGEASGKIKSIYLEDFGVCAAIVNYFL